MNSRFLARAAIYAALYAALTLAPGLNALAYGQVQFRVSEALMVFACVDPAAVVGSDRRHRARQPRQQPRASPTWSSASLLTLVAALLMYRIGLRWWALAVPVIVNGLGVAVELTLVLHLPFWVERRVGGRRRGRRDGHRRRGAVRARQALRRFVRTETTRGLTAARGRLRRRGRTT